MSAAALTGFRRLEVVSAPLIVGADFLPHPRANADALIPRSWRFLHPLYTRRFLIFPAIRRRTEDGETRELLLAGGIRLGFGDAVDGRTRGGTDPGLLFLSLFASISSWSGNLSVSLQGYVTWSEFRRVKIRDDFPQSCQLKKYRASVMFDTQRQALFLRVVCDALEATSIANEGKFRRLRNRWNARFWLRQDSTFLSTYSHPLTFRVFISVKRRLYRFCVAGDPAPASLEKRLPRIRMKFNREETEGKLYIRSNGLDVSEIIVIAARLISLRLKGKQRFESNRVRSIAFPFHIQAIAYNRK